MATKKVVKSISGFTVLLRDIRSLQIKVHYPKLTQKLQIDLDEAGQRKLRALIAESSEDQRLAGVIYAKARANRDSVQMRFDGKMGKWVVEARGKIAALKKEKKWDGSVTKEDVERWILANISEAIAAKKELINAEEIYRTAKSLRDSYDGRLSALQTYARLAQKRMEAASDDLTNLRKEQAAKSLGGDDL